MAFGIVRDSCPLEREKIVAIIIAGGLSRRMGGGHKALRLLAGRPMISHVWTIIAPQVAQLALNVNGPSEGFTALFPGTPILEDTHVNQGPLGGVLVGLRWAAQRGATRLLTVPGDTPFLPHDLVNRLIEEMFKNQTPVVCARSAGHLHPLVCIWDVALISCLMTFLEKDNLRIKDFLLKNLVKIVDFSATPLDHFMNMNTLADMQAAERIAQSLQQSC